MFNFDLKNAIDNAPYKAFDKEELDKLDGNISSSTTTSGGITSARIKTEK